ncbi:MAG TPA: fumarylacetoacetate hydrolase family protein [Pyrinomonadaceae bacterium]|nr:fumarylacetoacetate hydrolase family protein [Pyrinomonadaceae bacterium]
MKICRFQFGEMVSSGVLEGDHVVVFEDNRRKDEAFAFSDVKLLPPVAPSKIVCVGRNYAEHAAELGNEVPTEPLLFLKAPSAIINSGEAIVLPPQSQQVEHEGELAVVIGRRCKSLFDDEDAMRYVLGFTCLNDVTARDLQKKDGQFTRAKSFDTFCPVGPFIETELDLNQVTLTTRVNGKVRQFARMWQMVFPIDFLIRYISNMMTLMPGDVIATGTPSGVGRLEKGDVCEVEIDGIGTLRNPVE